MIPTAAQCKSVVASRRIDGMSARIAGSAQKDGAQNVIAIDQINAGNAGISTIITSHTRRHFVGFVPPTVTDYANAKIGDIYDQFNADSAESAQPNDFIRWAYTSAGWERMGGRKRVRTVTLFGHTDTQIDITKSGDVVTYTWDTTGTDPNFVTNGLKVGDKVTIVSTTFTDANEGTFVVVAASDAAISVVNADGVAESNKVLSQAIAAYATVEVADDQIIANYATATTITLPTAVGCAGKEISVKSIGTAAVTIDGYSTQTIDGIASVALNNGESVVLVSDGANWRVKAANAANVGVAPTVGKTTVTVAAGGAVTITAAQLLGGYIQNDPAGAVNMTTATAALIVAAIAGCAIGSSFEFVIENTADGSETITLVGGDGVTLESGHTMTVAQNYSRRFLAVVTATGTPAITVYSMGTYQN